MIKISNKDFLLKQLTTRIVKKRKILDQIREDKMNGIKNLQEEFKWILEFDKNLIGSTVYYDDNRYYIFCINLYEIMKTQWGTCRAYVNNVKSCRTRKEIGHLLTRNPFSFNIVYYNTSKSFRIYIYTGMSVIRIAREKIHSLSMFSFEQWLKKKKFLQKKCVQCNKNARYYVVILGYKSESIKYEDGFYCKSCFEIIPNDFINYKYKRW